MYDGSEQDTIIKELYNRYLSNGFVTEDDALACYAKHKMPLTRIDSITDRLLSIGVIIKVDEKDIESDDDVLDRTRTDYDSIYSEILQISPNLSILVNYVRAIMPPQFREWHNLIPQAQNGNVYARNRLFDMYLRVVIKTSLKFHRESDYELDDIIQVGAMGLLKAIKAYDSSKHGSFVSYMPFWVSQFITRAIHDLAKPIRIPVHMMETIDSVEQKLKSLQHNSNSNPTKSEIEDACQLPFESVTRILGYLKQPSSIEEFLQIDTDGSVSIEIEDHSISAIEEIIESIDLHNIFSYLFGTLKEKEAKVLRSRYGFDDGRPKTLEEVGASFGVTRERIRQIEAKAIKKIKHTKHSVKMQAYVTPYDCVRKTYTD